MTEKEERPSPTVLEPAGFQKQKQDAQGIWAFRPVTPRQWEEYLRMSDEELAQILAADNPYIKGLAPRFNWSNLNPREAEYDWQTIDRVIELANKYDKKILIRVIGGTDKYTTPAWALEKIKYVEIPRLEKEGQGILPLFWDPAFKKAWFDFIQALGARYHNYPGVQRVAMAAGNAVEMYYLRPDFSNELIQEIKNLGFSEEAVLGYWQELIDVYAESFPTKPLFLNLANLFPQREKEGIREIQEEVVRYALEKLGSRLYLQRNGLSATTEPEGLTISRRLMKENAATNIIGFQTLTPENHGDLLETFKRGLAYPISYLEVFTADLANSENEEAIQFLYRELEKRQKIKSEI